MNSLTIVLIILELPATAYFFYGSLVKVQEVPENPVYIYRVRPNW